MEQAPIVKELVRLLHSSVYTHYQVCKALGLDQSTLSRIVNGATSPRSDTMHKLAEFLGYDIVLVRKVKHDSVQAT